MSLDKSESEAPGGDSLRFGFGENWRRFLGVLDERRIDEAVESLRRMLGSGTLEGRTFLDVGSGSGLFSLAARRLGATVRSFDVDPQSVACTEELRRRYFPEDSGWTVGTGSIITDLVRFSAGSREVSLNLPRDRTRHFL